MGPGHRATECPFIEKISIRRQSNEGKVFIVNNKMFFNQDRIEFIFRECKKIMHNKYKKQVQFEKNSR